MTRNATRTLTAAETLLAGNVEMMLAGNGDADWTVTYVKRDGTHSVLTGTLLDIVGTYGTSTHAAKFDTAKGPRTVNLWAIANAVGTYECDSTVALAEHDALYRGALPVFPCGHVNAGARGPFGECAMAGC